MLASHVLDMTRAFVIRNSFVPYIVKVEFSGEQNSPMEKICFWKNVLRLSLIINKKRSYL